MSSKVYRIGPSDHDLVAWFERGGEPGATLLVDNWKLCAASDPGLAESLRWIIATVRDVRVVITAGAPDDVPEHLRSLVRTDFLALHDLDGFTKSNAWKGDWSRIPIGHDGARVVVELTHYDGQYRTGSHFHTTTRETLRSLVLGLMTTHSPKLFQVLLVDAHDTDAFAGLDKAPHVHSHFHHVATDPAPVITMLLAESERRLDLVGNTWTIFDHRGLDQVLPQLLVCVAGLGDILAAHPEFATALATVAQDVGKSGMQLLLDSPHDTAPQHVPACSVPENLDDAAKSLPELMRADEPVPDFLALHGLPDGFDRQRTWRRRPARRQFRVRTGVDEHGQPVEIDLKTSSLQDGMGPHGEVVGPDRTDLLRALLLGQMLWHPPDDLQLVLVDFHGTGVFAGLDKAPHAYGHHRGLTPATADRLVEALKGEHERRTRILVAAEYRTTWDYRAARDNGAPLDPLPELLLCLDGAPELLRTYPDFLEVLQGFGRLGRSYGEHLLLSGSTPTAELRSFLGYRFEFAGNWTRRISRSVENLVLPPDLDRQARSLPHAMQKVEPLHDPFLPPPLHEWSRLALDDLGTISPEHGAVPLGLRDNPFEHGVEVFYATFGQGDQGGHGAIVGKPGSGRTTAMRTLTESITRTFGSTDGFRLADGPLYGRPEERHVVVTASTWAEVPQFIRDDLAWGVELKLADPSWSAVDERRQANLPDRPGTGLCVQVKRQVRIATS
ncbi:FtsK/SpoIIIE domain-containing protein [Lentzea sp. NPDC059081]|uniref:FtsK/SpoIIIE domain-containing protein n=1 Tax=Lentzea sp. NPDC059081 TaxID=3346719 RepID=UPI003694FFA4